MDVGVRLIGQRKFSDTGRTIYSYTLGNSDKKRTNRHTRKFPKDVLNIFHFERNGGSSDDFSFFLFSYSITVGEKQMYRDYKAPANTGSTQEDQLPYKHCQKIPPCDSYKSAIIFSLKQSICDLSMSLAPVTWHTGSLWRQPTNPLIVGIQFNQFNLSIILASQ